MKKNRIIKRERTQIDLLKDFVSSNDINSNISNNYVNYIND